MPGTLRETIELFDPSLPLERARTIPGRWYWDPAVAAAERFSVFGDSWQLVARADQLGLPGAFVTADIAGEPVVVVRGEDGALRAFFNVCRHRAACVVTEPEGVTGRLRCRYHGWTYDLAGRLRGTPEFDGVADFRREDHGLVPLAVDSWGPLVLVHAGRSPRPLAEQLAPLPERMGALADLRFVERREYQLACNWKVFVDNYLDGGYHVNSVHPGLAGVLDYAHYRTDCFELTSLQHSPLRPAEPDAHGSSVSGVRQGENALYGWAYPNLMVNLYAGVMDTNLVLPAGQDRCRVIIDFYFSRTEGEAARRFAEESVAVGHRIQLEDVGVCEDVQRGLASRAYDAGRFSVRREAAVYHFHRLLAADLRQAAT
ncbi:MAG TPA: aromatic ring-hydroxylating dioxygenase subunit alpha [Myxococcaceae bacterium]|nr:aromatic ring-hydroxylating dioxygenase subunit alpha [Myxococcaceae bacterium]